MAWHRNLDERLLKVIGYNTIRYVAYEFLSTATTASSYDSFDAFADHSTTNRQPYWFTPLLRSGSTIAICCWPEHQSLLPTSCSGSWMLQRELWAARRSTTKYSRSTIFGTTAAWHTCFTLSCICSMWQIESHTSLGWRCTSACMDYLSELCTAPVAQVAERQHHRSASRHLRVVARFQPSVSARYVRPSHLRCRWTNDMELVPKPFFREPDMQIDCFRRTLKTCLFDQYSAHWAH